MQGSIMTFPKRVRLTLYLFIYFPERWVTRRRRSLRTPRVCILWLTGFFCTPLFSPSNRQLWVMAFPKCGCRCSAHMHHGIMRGIRGICAMDFRGVIAEMVMCIYTLGFVGCGCWNTEKDFCSNHCGWGWITCFWAYVLLPLTIAYTGVEIVSEKSREENWISNLFIPWLFSWEKPFAGCWGQISLCASRLKHVGTHSLEQFCENKLFMLRSYLPMLVGEGISEFWNLLRLLCFCPFEGKSLKLWVLDQAVQTEYN